MLISILGSFGSGKTLLLAILGSDSKRIVHSNFLIRIPNYKPLKVLDLLNLENNIDMFIDEGYTWLESRISSSKLNRYLSYIILQSRKRTLDIYITAQLFSTVDLRFRDNSDIVVKCIKKSDGFKYSFFNIRNRTIKSWILPFTEAEKYYELYDTFEIIEPHDKKALEFKLLMDNPLALDTKIREICRDIYPILQDIGKITHDSVKYALISSKYNVSYEKYVHMYMKGSSEYVINQNK